MNENNFHEISGMRDLEAKWEDYSIELFYRKVIRQELDIFWGLESKHRMDVFTQQKAKRF